jgi:hypothetical protein
MFPVWKTGWRAVAWPRSRRDAILVETLAPGKEMPGTAMNAIRYVGDPIEGGIRVFHTTGRQNRMALNKMHLYPDCQHLRRTKLIIQEWCWGIDGLAEAWICRSCTRRRK